MPSTPKLKETGLQGSGWYWPTISQDSDGIPVNDEDEKETKRKLAETKDIDSGQCGYLFHERDTEFVAGGDIIRKGSLVNIRL